METLDHDYSQHTKQGAGDEKLFVIFENFFTPDTMKSEEEGRPIFIDEVYIRIVTPGDRDNVIFRPIRPTDKHRFPRQWAAFQTDATSIGDGTRLEEWTMMSRSMVEELKYLGFRTVEQVAEANDSACQKVPGLREMKSRAGAWLDKAKKTAEVTKAQKVIDDQNAQIEALQNQIAELAKLVKPAEGGTPLPK